MSESGKKGGLKHLLEYIQKYLLEIIQKYLIEFIQKYLLKFFYHLLLREVLPMGLRDCVIGISYVNTWKEKKSSWMREKTSMRDAWKA